MPLDPRRQELLIFEATQRCDLDCLHCYNPWKKAPSYPRGELATDETLEMLGKVLDESGARQLTLSGGEPLLRTDLCALIDFLVDRGVQVDLITNGQRLDEAALDRLTPSRIGVFELPLLSSRAEVHDRHAGRPGAFERATLAMAELKLRRQRVVAVFVATRLNLPTLEETLELCVALGLDGLMFNRFNPGGRGAANLDLLQASPEELRAALDLCEALSIRHELPVSCSIAMPPCLFEHARWPHLGFGFCSTGTPQSYLTLDPLGNLRPCNHSALILGNVRHRNFWDLSGGPRLAAFQAARPRFCEPCALVERCQGGCKAAAEVCAGDPWACDPFLGAFRHQAVRIAAGDPLGQ